VVCHVRLLSGENFPPALADREAWARPGVGQETMYEARDYV